MNNVKTLIIVWWNQTAAVFLCGREEYTNKIDMLNIVSREYLFNPAPKNDFYNSSRRNGYTKVFLQDDEKEMYKEFEKLYRDVWAMSLS